MCCEDAEAISGFPTVVAGSTIEGWVYYLVSAADATPALLAFMPDATFDDIPGGTAFFATS